MKIILRTENRLDCRLRCLALSFDNSNNNNNEGFLYQCTCEVRLAVRVVRLSVCEVRLSVCGERLSELEVILLLVW